MSTSATVATGQTTTATVDTGDITATSSSTSTTATIDGSDVSTSTAKVRNDTSTTPQLSLNDLDDYLAFSVLKMGTPGRRWRKAWWSKASTACRLYVIGDSITQGWAASSATARFVDIMSDKLYSAAGQQDAYGYVPLGINGAYSPKAWSDSGDITSVATHGLGYNSGTFVNQIASPTVTADRIEVFYATTDDSDSDLKIRRDSVLQTTVTIATGTDAGSQAWDSGALTRAAHTIQLESADASPTRAEGAYFYDGNYSAGLQVWMGGHFGYKASHFAAAGSVDWWTAAFDTHPPDCVMIALGTNEQSAGDTASNLTTNVGAMITQINTAMDDSTQPPTIVVCAPHDSGSTASQEYREAAWQVRHDFPNQVAVLDWYSLLGSTGGSNDIYSLTSGGKHPTTTGHAMLGNGAARFLLHAAGD